MILSTTTYYFSAEAVSTLGMALDSAFALVPAVASVVSLSLPYEALSMSTSFQDLAIPLLQVTFLFILVLNMKGM